MPVWTKPRQSLRRKQQIILMMVTMLVDTNHILDSTMSLVKVDIKTESNQEGGELDLY